LGKEKSKRGKQPIHKHGGTKKIKNAKVHEGDRRTSAERKIRELGGIRKFED